MRINQVMDDTKVNSQFQIIERQTRRTFISSLRSLDCSNVNKSISSGRPASLEQVAN